MNEELVTARSIYNNRDDLPFHVTIHLDLTTSELKDVLARESDFVHYIGHIDADGFRCSNGVLDTTEIETVGLKSFFLNACHSFEQGHALLEAGAIGGIVTSSEIQNADAIAVGKLIAQFLNVGLPLYGVRHLLSKIEEDDRQYRTIGDETLSVAQTEEGPPFTAEVVGETNQLEFDTYVSKSFDIGSIYHPYLSAAESYYLVSNRSEFDSVSKASLVAFLNSGRFPILFDRKHRWSTDIKTSEL